MDLVPESLEDYHAAPDETNTAADPGDSCWRFWRGRRSQSGQDLVEYALILGFIAVACAAIIPYTATESMRTIYSKIAEILMSSTNQT